MASDRFLRLPSIAAGVAAAALLLVPTARAQDEFDDEFGGGEFDDEFADPAAEPDPDDDPAPGDAGSARRPTGASGGGADDGAFDDPFDDPLDDGPGADGAARPSSEAPPATSPAPGDGLPDVEEDRVGDDAPPELVGTDEVPGAIPPEVREDRARRMRTHNTIDGPIGGLRVVDAGSGAPGSFRLQLLAEYFTADDFLEDGDSNQRIAGTLSLSWTPLPFLELFASVRAGANSNPEENPELFQVLGDTILGAKGFYSVLPWLTVGGDFSVLFLNTVGDIGVVLDSTSFSLRAGASADLRYLDNPIPFIARLSFRYLFDRSENLIRDVEQDRFNAIPEDEREDEFSDETDQLVTRIERFALGINRTDFFDIGVGFESPLEVTDGFFIHPILEWTLRVPANRQEYNCLIIEDDDGRIPPGEDSCLDLEGFSSFPQLLTLGVRLLPPVRGLTATLGIDVGLTGVNTDVRELAATAPWNLLFGVSYAYDATPLPPDPIVRTIEREVEAEPEAPELGRVLGRVVTQGTNAPVEGAVVRFPGRDVTALYTSPDGGFRSYEFEPGRVAMEVSHPDHQPGRCEATLPEGGEDVEVTCPLVSAPRFASLRARVTNEDGDPVPGATITIEGRGDSATTGSDGTALLEELDPGTVGVRVEAPGYLLRLIPGVRLTRDAPTQLDVTILKAPENPTVIARRGQIVLRRRINFATDSAEILPNSENLLTEIASVLIQNPQIRKVEIQGHTDNRGGAGFNMDLSQRRAAAVRDWLIRNGVDAGRLEAKGYGMTRPIVPNITAANRARNRRVQFIIRERAD